MLQIQAYGDLHKAVLDYNPFIINNYGRIACAVKFYCDIGNRKITRGFTAYPNESSKQDLARKFGDISQALRHLTKYGTNDPTRWLVNNDPIQPVVGVTKALRLKDNDDPWHMERNRYHRFNYRNAIVTPDGSLDLIGRYTNSSENKRRSFTKSDPCHIQFTFKAQLIDGGQPRFFQEEELEDAFIYLKQHERAINQGQAS